MDVMLGGSDKKLGQSPEAHRSLAVESDRHLMINSGSQLQPCGCLAQPAENTMQVGVPSAWYFPVNVNRPFPSPTRKLVMTSLR